MIHLLAVLLAVGIILLAYQNLRMAFIVAYYEQKLINRGIKDGVKDMAWWKLWIS